MAAKGADGLSFGAFSRQARWSTSGAIRAETTLGPSRCLDVICVETDDFEWGSIVMDLPGVGANARLPKELSELGKQVPCGGVTAIHTKTATNLFGTSHWSVLS